jgi:transposase
LHRREHYEWTTIHPEFKDEAVKQVTEKGHSVAEVAARLGTTTHSLYAWIKRYDPQQPKIIESNDPSAELAKLKKNCNGLLKKGTY